MKFRKKPVVVEAIQFTGHNKFEIADWALQENGATGITFPKGTNNIEIFTLEGTMTASPGDFIIKGVKGEFYPCKPDIFELTYEVAAE